MPRRCTVTPLVRFENVSRAAWEKIFGTPEETARRRARAIRAQKSRARQALKAKAGAVQLGIHTDEPYGKDGLYSPCVRAVLRGRADVKAWEKKGFYQTG